MNQTILTLTSLSQLNSSFKVKILLFLRRVEAAGARNYTCLSFNLLTLNHKLKLKPQTKNKFTELIITNSEHIS